MGARPARAALVVIAALPLLSWAAAHAQVDNALFGALRSWFDLQCHNALSRSFAWLATPLPVCARCLGIYLGLGAAGLTARGQARWSVLALALTAGAAAMVGDVLTEGWGLRPAFAPLRLLTGAAFAFPAGAALIRIAREGQGAGVPLRA